MKTAYYLSEVMRRAKDQALKNDDDVIIDVATIMLWFNVSPSAAYGILSVLRHYLGLPPHSEIRLTAQDLGIKKNDNGEVTKQ